MTNILNPMNISTVPSVIKQTNNGERGYDIFSRILEDRIIMLCDEVNHDTAQLVIAELLYLESVDPDADITLYINSPGGSVSDGLAIYDTMNYIKCDVSTVCIGHAASMGAFLLSGGEKGKRYILPNAEVMIHQPLGGMQGQATDMKIAMEHMDKIKDKLTKYLAAHTGQDYDTIWKDTDRDNWMSAEEAVAYGLVDQVLTKR
jgi:ATP-dependent Clp protease protease subunit